MKSEDLRKILKPLIKQCIKEVIFEEGYVSKIVSETIVGMKNSEIIVEKKISAFSPEKKDNIEYAREKLLDSLGKDSYNGVNIFENVKPLSNSDNENSAKTALSSYASSDSGVDISSLPGARNWGLLINKEK